MAYFAELNGDNVVLQVISVNNSLLLDEQGFEVEQKGINFCKQLFGEHSSWKQTSYNTRANKHLTGKTPFRKNYAGIDFTYDEQRDAFIPPKPEGDGWILEEETCLWRNPELEAAEEATQIGVTRV